MDETAINAFDATATRRWTLYFRRKAAVLATGAGGRPRRSDDWEKLATVTPELKEAKTGRYITSNIQPFRAATQSLRGTNTREAERVVSPSC